jgi:hypothetical protein
MRTCQYSGIDRNGDVTVCTRPATVYLPAIKAHLCAAHAVRLDAQQRVSR